LSPFLKNSKLINNLNNNKKINVYFYKEEIS